ncbi:Nse4 C-terminal-domain-containing protein [Leucosporidium creatinivorum]|uniref:Non-structural maintenance of chromosomes element 4 n=1 Tax=Leucosporidium creatinivorum TaxID=106004 RepID=A0A1Y2EAP6_9BASI|nr:Nse4 C-terminal-domain-containing protein [Leucosporidium creatinivorum]
MSRSRAQEDATDDDALLQSQLEEQDDPVLDQDDEEEKPMTDEQKIQKTRITRTELRDLGQRAEDERDNINDITPDDISKTIAQANLLFKDVKAPAEAILDSKILVAASGAGALKARQLKLDANAFDTVEFLNKLVLFMGGRLGAQGQKKGKGKRRAGEEDEEDEEDDEGGAGLKWGRVGRILSGESRRPATMDFMFGPLDLEIKEKKARQVAKRQKVDESQRVRPEELTAGDVEKNKNETGRMVKEIASILDESGTNGLPYLRFVVNPHSFAQTVENVFYLSFLVRENKVCIETEDNEESEYYKDVIVYGVDAPEEGDAAKSSKTQLVFEVTQKLWKDAIDAYDITEPIIPHRDPFKQTAEGEKRAKKW